MALYQSLTSSSTPEQIAAAYKEAIASAGGDTATNQKIATDYLTNLGIATPTIQSAYQQYLASPTSAPAQTSYFQANPDVAAAYAQNSYGMTPEQFASYHYNTYGQSEGRTAPTTSGIASLPAAPARPAPDPGAPAVKTGTTVESPTLRYYTGKTYQGDQVLNLAKQLATIADPSEIRGGVFGENKPSVGFDYSEAQKILGGEPTVYDQVLLDSAANLIDQGITDISQLKPPTYAADESGVAYTDNKLFAGQTYSGPGVTHYQIQFDDSGKPKFTTTGADTGDKGLIAPLALGASFFLPGIIGAALAPGATAATQAAIGGAAFGGGISALTGQNVLKGALLGGLGGYASSTLGQALKAGVTDVNALKAAADADLAAGMLPEFGTNAAYDTAMANLMAGSPGAVQQLEDIVGVNRMNNLAAVNPADFGAESAVGATYGPDNIDVGGGWNPATRAGDLTTANAAQGLGSYGAEVPAVAAAASGLPAGLGTAAKLAAAALGAKGVQSLLTPQGTYGMGAGGDGFNPLGGYKFAPGAFQASIPDPAMFRPREGVVTVADAIRQAQANQQGVQAMAEGGSTKPKYTGKAALSAMSPWERAAAQLNNAAYFARMPVGIAAPQNAIGQLGQFAAGGGISDLGGYSDGGRMLKGAGDGMSDSIPATIGGKRPARLADGEFVVPADVVSGLGNGSTDAGAKQLYQMMDRVRQARTGTKKQGKEINAPKHLPA